MNLPDEVRELIKEEVQKNFDRIKEEVLSELKKMFQTSNPNIKEFVIAETEIKKRISENPNISFLLSVHLGFLEKLTYLNIFSDETISIWRSRGIDLEKRLFEICAELEKYGILSISENKKGLKYIVVLNRDIEEIIERMEIEKLRRMMEFLEMILRNKDDISFDWNEFITKAILKVRKRKNNYEIVLEGGKVVSVGKDPKSFYKSLKENHIYLNVGVEEANRIIEYLEYLSRREADDDMNEFLIYWVNEIRTFKRVPSIRKIKENPTGYLFLTKGKVYISTEIEKNLKRIMGITSKIYTFFEKVGVNQIGTMNVLGTYVRIFERNSLEKFIKRFYPEFSFDMLQMVEEKTIIEKYPEDEIEAEIDELDSN